MSLMLPSPLNRVVIAQFAQHHSSTVMAVVKVVLTIYPSRIRRHYIKAESAKLLEKNLRDDVKRQHGKAYA